MGRGGRREARPGLFALLGPVCRVPARWGTRQHLFIFFAANLSYLQLLKNIF